jgi:Tol biopolymer transport system component
MPLTPGTRLGPYEIKSPLGAGGMGEVYRAADSRLGRDVAIKVLPPHLSGSEEARARFEREARTVSSLNHPHICTLYDVGREAGTDFLVMELIDGETLADRLARGPLPLPDVLRIGRQVADALDRAHRAGVIHRDLKPGNIMLARNGAKLMDFGLSRPGGPGQPGSGTVPAGSLLTGSPTLAQPLTTQGSILGTFQYMAPEQLEGKADVDARADIWALGCVLYEMLTGQRPFQGTTQASLISSIMRDTPRPMAERAPMSPPALDRLVNACLAKDVDDRIRSAHDVALQLAWIADGGSGVTPPGGVAVPARNPAFGGERLLWIGALAAVAAVAVWALLSRPAPTTAPSVRRFRISERPGEHFPSSTETAISPDGRTLAYVAEDTTGGSAIWLRPLDSFELRALPNTTGAIYLFWSPDSRSIGFVAGGRLKRMGLDDADAVSLCDAASARGASWGSAGEIAFAPSPDGPIFAVNENGGTPRAVTTLAPGEIGHRLPCFLPDGRHFLFLAIPPRGATYDTYVGSLDGERKGPIVQATTVARWAPPGYLTYVRGRSMTAQPFDPKRRVTTGEPMSFGNLNLDVDTIGEPVMTASTNGVLVVTEPNDPPTRLEWRDRAGRHLGYPPVPPGPYHFAVPSPDGRLAVGQEAMTGEGRKLLLFDLVNGTATPLTRKPGFDIYAYWYDGGRRIVYATNRDGPYKIVSLDPFSGEETVLHDSPVYAKESPTISADGRWLVFGQDNGDTGQDIMLIDLQGDRTARAIIQGPTDEFAATVSPNGRMVGYSSTESGKAEVYLASLPDGRSRRRVSTRGGSGPVFVRGGRELIYFGPVGDLWSVAIDPDDPQAVVGQPTPLFSPGKFAIGAFPSDDGERILLTTTTAPVETYHTVILDWTTALRR